MRYAILGIQPVRLGFCLGLSLLALAACQGVQAGPTPTPTARAQGAISGRVNIGPLCPVEPCPGPTADVYSTRALLFQPEEGQPVRVPLAFDGTFEAAVPAGTYAVTLTECDFLGCAHGLPVTITVSPGQTIRFDLDIDTGIR